MTTEFTAAAPVRRSNRPLTHFACQIIDRFIANQLYAKRYDNHNTAVEYRSSSRDRTLCVYLYETELLHLVLGSDGRPVYLKISIGDRFTPRGHPAQTVVERMNGILDTLGIHGCLPQRVRLFIDRESDTFYLGKGAGMLPMGQAFARSVVITPDSDALIIESSDLGLSVDSVPAAAGLLGPRGPLARR